MTDATIELLQNYAPEKMQWPAAHQEKIDGVPVIISYHGSSTTNAKPGWRAYSRQGTRITSIDHIIQEVAYLFFHHQHIELVGELYIEGQPFKYIGGRARQIQRCQELRLHLFDVVINPAAHPVASVQWDTRECWPEAYDWITRMRWLEDFLELQKLRTCPQYIEIIGWTGCYSADDAERAHAALMHANPKAEGSVLHSYEKEWEPGKRSWLVQRMKPVPTIDLRITRLEEAVSASGKPLGMVGRMVAEFSSMTPHGTLTTNEIGIGPGKLSHPERKALWSKAQHGQFTPRIAEIKYMRDDTYEALRQPTFQVWRDDKATPDTYQRA